MITREKIKETLRWKGTKSIEIRFFSFIMRATLALIFFGYTSYNAVLTYRWAQIKHVRSKDMDFIKTVIQHSIKNKDMEWANKWALYRPRDESKYIIDTLTPYSAHLTPSIFINFAKRSGYLNDIEQKKFWLMLAHFRLKFDAMRCGGVDTLKSADGLLNVLYMFNPTLLEPMTKAETIRLSREILEFDHKHPANNWPQDTCNQIKLMTASFVSYPIDSEASWGQTRFNLRYLSDLSLLAAEKELLGQK